MPLSKHLIATINGAVRDFHAIEIRRGVTHTSLAEIKERLLDLVGGDTFTTLAPPASNSSVYYVLSEDVSPYGLYLNVAPHG